MTSNSMPRIGFIGAGNMASCLIGGLLQAGWSRDAVSAADANASQRERVAGEFDIRVEQDNAAAVRDCDIVILAVKPQSMRDVARALAPALQPSQTVVSVAAGIPARALVRWLTHDQACPAIVRAMPNTPALLGAGATGLLPVNNVSDAGRDAVTAVFDTAGVVEWVTDEDQLNAVIAVSGSGPAYFFAFIEAMSNQGRELGLDAATAERLAIATASGAARMAAETDTPVATLRERVTSPGGTTAEALRALNAGGLETLVGQAMRAAVSRAQAMADEFANDTETPS